MSSTFEIKGFFEEVWDAERRKVLGIRKVAEQPGREYGMKGESTPYFVDSVTLDGGHRSKVIKATKRKPLLIFTRLYPVCGRMLKEYGAANEQRPAFQRD